MTDKNYCMSSFLSFRCIEDDSKEFCDELNHRTFSLPLKKDRIPVRTAEDIDRELGRQIERFKNCKRGIMLSGGMDSANVASYLPGSDAYTFRFLGGEYQQEELRRAENYAKRYDLRLHYVDIDFDRVKAVLETVVRSKGAPVHSIEPQIYQAALQAKADGVEIMFIGNSSDPVFGGFDSLLSKDWKLEEFIDRYTFVKPEKVLNDPVSMRYLFERYKTENGRIDFLRFIDEVYTAESAGSYDNAFHAADMPFIDPYAGLIMAEPLDLERIRSGDSKYLIRQLFKMKYPDIPVPEKVPMPRPVDSYFADWSGPKRPEFRSDLKISDFSGNQKWLIWCLEYFLDMIEPCHK